MTATLNFLPAREHFTKLVEGLSPLDAEVFEATSVIRTETAFRNRNFIIYEMEGDEPMLLDTVTVTRFDCNERRGATVKLLSQNTGEELVVGYSPVGLFGFDVCAWLPLHSRIVWDAPLDPETQNLGRGSLGFPICIQVMSRRVDTGHYAPRTPGFDHCETGNAFYREFPQRSGR